MCASKSCELDYETHIELAVTVFKTQNKVLVDALKNFLKVLPSPKCVERVLIAAIYQLAETDPEICRWLLLNPSYLEPELDLVKLAKESLSAWLQERGFVLGQDFIFEPSGRLQLNEKAKAAMIAESLSGDRLLLEEILLN